MHQMGQIASYPYNIHIRGLHLYQSHTKQIPVSAYIILVTQQSFDFSNVCWVTGGCKQCTCRNTRAKYIPGFYSLFSHPVLISSHTTPLISLLKYKYIAGYNQAKNSLSTWHTTKYLQYYIVGRHTRNLKYFCKARAGSLTQVARQRSCLVYHTTYNREQYGRTTPQATRLGQLPLVT